MCLNENVIEMFSHIQINSKACIIVDIQVVKHTCVVFF